MRISVFGLGYVGVVTSACLAHEGHDVLGIDVAVSKVELINSGKSPIIEEDIDRLIATTVQSGKLRASLDASEALITTDLAIVCVGTPSLPDGSIDTTHVLKLADQIGALLPQRTRPFHIVVRSTMVPGTLRGQFFPRLESASGHLLGEGYDVSFHPEFLREGTSVYDFYNPPKIVVGERMPGSGQVVLDLYDDKFSSPRIRSSIEIAEMVKYCDNLFHAVKITFANEIGVFCHLHGINSHEVMDIFSADTKLNISSKYLQPGFAFGGSCLPKDLRAFLSECRTHHIRTPMLENILVSNGQQIERALEFVLQLGVRRVGMYGIAFKAGTDDLRESPLVELAERFLGKGRELIVYDEKVQMARLVGGNRSYIDEKLPHLADFMTNQVADLERCEVITVGHPVSDSLIEQWLSHGIQIMDLTGARSGQNRPHLKSIV